MSSRSRPRLVLLLGTVVIGACVGPAKEAAARVEIASPAQVSQDVQPPAAHDLDPDVEYNKGSELAAARRFSEARQIFETAARRFPHDESLEAGVAVFGDLAAKRVSEDVVQLLFKAGQHASAGSPAEARADVEEAIRLAPGYPRAHGLRGTLLLEQGMAAEALVAFDRSVELDPQFTEGHYHRGVAHFLRETQGLRGGDRG
jgi:tetratricopeptide (TPR) repeat protein